MSVRAALLGAALLSVAPTPALCRHDVTLGDIARNLTAGVEDGEGVLQELLGGQQRLERQLTELTDRLAAAAEGGGGQCPAGWRRHGNSCYILPSVTATWMGASVLCPAMDRRARLASLHADNQEVIVELVAASPAEYTFLGGVRLKQGGTDWGWQDGTPFDHVNWAPGQPDGAQQDCICMQGPKSGYSAKVGQLHDGGCITVHTYLVCQINL